jgi:uncharacterized protein
MRELTPLEARVLAVLAEKHATVPDSYPLSLNTLVLGCNQKTARDPVMNATDAQVLTAIDGLKALALIFETSGSRVTRFEHNLGKGLGVPTQSAALLTALMLRGAQTSAELRLNAERLHRFADISSVEGFLDELASKAPPRVRKLPKAPGEREVRWVHLLCGEPVVAVGDGRAAAADGEPGVSLPAYDVDAGELAALRAQQLRLADEVQRLKGQVQRLAGELGVTLD